MLLLPLLILVSVSYTHLDVYKRQMPDSVVSIGEGAFCDCSGLTSITIPNDIINIDDYAFKGCIGLTSIIAVSYTHLDVYKRQTGRKTVLWRCCFSTRL